MAIRDDLFDVGLADILPTISKKQVATQPLQTAKFIESFIKKYRRQHPAKVDVTVKDKPLTEYPMYGAAKPKKDTFRTLSFDKHPKGFVDPEEIALFMRLLPTYQKVGKKGIRKYTDWHFNVDQLFDLVEKQGLVKGLKRGEGSLNVLLSKLWRQQPLGKTLKERKKEVASVEQIVKQTEKFGGEKQVFDISIMAQAYKSGKWVPPVVKPKTAKTPVIDKDIQGIEIR